MNLRFFYYAIMTLFVCSCGGKDRDEAPQKEPGHALQLTDFAAESFADLPLENKCEGIKQFILDFQRNYLPGVEVSFNQATCKHAFLFSHFSAYDVQPKFTKGNDSLELGILVSYTVDKEKELMQPGNPSFGERTDGGWVKFEHDASVSFLGENFEAFMDTFTAWVKPFERHPIGVYGHSYADFVAKVEKTFGPGSEGMLLKRPIVKFRVIPDANPMKKGQGTIEFLEADLSSYTSVNEAGEVEQQRFLNCLDLECLRGSNITYEIGSQLTLFAESVENTAAPGWEQRDYFSIPLFFLKDSM